SGKAHQTFGVGELRTLDHTAPKVRFGTKAGYQNSSLVLRFFSTVSSVVFLCVPSCPLWWRFSLRHSPLSLFFDGFLCGFPLCTFVSSVVKVFTWHSALSFLR